MVGRLSPRGLVFLVGLSSALVLLLLLLPPGAARADTPTPIPTPTPTSTATAAPGLIGGPDTFGYRYLTDGTGGGPVYAFEDISATGLLAFNAGSIYDDAYAGPFPISFSFPLYGRGFSQFWVNSNGYLTFDGGSSNYSSPPSNYAVMPFFGDQYVRADTRVYYQVQSNPTRLVVEFSDLDSYGGCCRKTFEVVLYPTGDVVFYYQSVGTRPSAVGLDGTSYARQTQVPTGIARAGRSLLVQWPRSVAVPTPIPTATPTQTRTPTPTPTPTPLAGVWASVPTPVADDLFGVSALGNEAWAVGARTGSLAVRGHRPARRRRRLEQPHQHFRRLPARRRRRRARPRLGGRLRRHGLPLHELRLVGGPTAGLDDRLRRADALRRRDRPERRRLGGRLCRPHAAVRRRLLGVGRFRHRVRSRRDRLRFRRRRLGRHEHGYLVRDKRWPPPLRRRRLGCLHECHRSIPARRRPQPRWHRLDGRRRRPAPPARSARGGRVRAAAACDDRTGGREQPDRHRVHPLLGDAGYRHRPGDGRPRHGRGRGRLLRRPRRARTTRTMSRSPA